MLKIENFLNVSQNLHAIYAKKKGSDPTDPVVKNRIQLNPDPNPAKNLNPDPEDLESGSGSEKNKITLLL